MVEIGNIKDFNLEQIFDCGQCFRWTKQEDESYLGIAFGKPVEMRFESSEENPFEGKLTIDNIDEAEFNSLWKDYLDLNKNYGDIKNSLSLKDSVMSEAIKSGQGIRLLRQEAWETLISFIISQNNNIPRIKKCIEGLCENFGEPAGEYAGKNWFEFPKAETLAQLTEEDLAPIKLGYRSKYIIETSKRIVTDKVNLEHLREGSTAEGYEYLTSLCGVGPKVANCILLFGLGKHETFPIDVWVRRVMNRLYGIEENDMKSMAKYAESYFGEYGGIAQQYLFYHIRQISKEL